MFNEYRPPAGGNTPQPHPERKIDPPRGQTGSRDIREPENPDDEGRTPNEPNEPVRDEERKE